FFLKRLVCLPVLRFFQPLLMQVRYPRHLPTFFIESISPELRPDLFRAEAFSPFSSRKLVQSPRAGPPSHRALAKSRYGPLIAFPRGDPPDASHAARPRAPGRVPRSDSRCVRAAPACPAAAPRPPSR